MKSPPKASRDTPRPTERPQEHGMRAALALALVSGIGCIHPFADAPPGGVAYSEPAATGALEITMNQALGHLPNHPNNVHNAQSAHKHRAWVGVLMALCALTAPGRPVGAATVDERFALALEAYERCHWQQAYAALGELADGGHGGAARIALQMARHGGRLYGGHFGLDAARKRHWAELAGDDLAGSATR